MIHLVLALLVIPPAHAEDFVEQKKGTQVLGKELSASLQAGLPQGSRKTQVKTGFNVLGSAMQAFTAIVQPPRSVGGASQTEAYSFGKRIFSESSLTQENGLLKYTVGIPPIELRIPAILYPVGPVILEVDGGARFMANLAVQNSTEISFPLQYSAFGAQLQAAAVGSGFIEGYAKLLILRAGVGGQLDLLDAHADVNVRYTFGEEKPLVLVSAMAQFLKGRIFGFVDVFGFLELGWNRLIDYAFYDWNGYCFATDNLQCPAE